jgi:hypothetical protein
MLSVQRTKSLYNEGVLYAPPIRMQPNTYRKALRVMLFLCTLVCALLVSPRVVAAGTYTAAVTYTKINGDPPVGGVILGSSHLLVPWMGVLVVLALIVAATIWRGKHR